MSNNLEKATRENEVRFKVCYVTMESIAGDPIIKSQVISLLRELSKLDPSSFEFTLITFEKSLDADLICSSKESYYDVEIKPISYTNHVINQLKLLLFLIKESKKFNIIHVRSYLPMLVVSILKPFYRYKVVFDPRGLFGDEILYYNKFSLKGRLFKFLEKYFFKIADFNVFVSKYFSDYVIDNYRIDSTSTAVIPTFSISGPVVSFREDSTRFGDYPINLLSQKYIKLCYSGSLEGWQCFDEILRFFSYIEKENENVIFVFCSKSIEAMKLRVFKSLPSEKCFFYSLEPSELRYVIGRCDYGIIFRESHLINRVASPIKINDYLLSGVKIISTRGIGDSEDFVIKNDLGLILDNFSEFTFKKIASSITKTDESEKIRVIDVVNRERDISVAVASYARVYENVINS